MIFMVRPEWNGFVRLHLLPATQVRDIDLRETHGVQATI
jgi:hypothetical protein